MLPVLLSINEETNLIGWSNIVALRYSEHLLFILTGFKGKQFLQLDFSSEPGVANETLENEPKKVA